MLNTVQQLIIDDLVTTLQGVTAANGYEFTVKAVEEFEVEGVGSALRPLIVVWSGAMDLENEAGGRSHWRFRVELDCYLVHNPNEDSDASSKVLTRFTGDVVKAVMADRTRGGNALDCKVVGVDPIPMLQNEGLDINVGITLEIRYRHVATNPAQGG